MTFTPAELTAITIALGALVGTILTGVANIITAARTERKVDQASGKVDETLAEAKVIKGHVNSTATAAAAKIDAMQKQIDQLVSQLSDSKQVAAVLASNAAKAIPVETVLAAHDAWERDERSQLTADVAENTRLTQEIRDAVVPETKQEP